jgi:hypothetical protein
VRPPLENVNAAVRTASCFGQNWSLRASLLELVDDRWADRDAGIACPVASAAVASGSASRAAPVTGDLSKLVRRYFTAALVGHFGFFLLAVGRHFRSFIAFVSQRPDHPFAGAPHVALNVRGSTVNWFTDAPQSDFS